MFIIPVNFRASDESDDREDNSFFSPILFDKTQTEFTGVPPGPKPGEMIHTGMNGDTSNPNYYVFNPERSQEKNVEDNSGKD